jgi:hypothetical protein
MLDSHLSDEKLLLAADGELSAAETAEVSSHLARCWSCRSRKQDIESAVVAFVRLHRESLDPLLPPPAGPRALLKAQMAQLSTTPMPWWSRWSVGAARRVAVAAASLTLALAGFWFFSPKPVTPVPVSFPEPSLTPGAVVALNRDQICRAPQPKNRIVPAALQRRVFAEYGIPRAEPRAYEIDYLITPALGGSDDIRNLWPQSYSSAQWNARVKDELEDRLHDMVCDGRLDLVAAQHDLATDWIAAYKKYFHTDKPVEMHP